MRIEFRAILDLLRMLLLGLGLGFSSSSLWAQDTASPEAAQTDPPAVETEVSDEAPQLTEIERLRRLESDTEADRKRLAEIKEDLAQREEFIDDLLAKVSAAEAEVAAKKVQLEELGGAEASEEASQLANQIVRLEEIIRVLTKQSDIAFQSAKTLQDQIVTLEQKIANMERQFQEMVGPTAEDLEARAEPEVQAPAAPETATPGLTPGQLLIPGSGVPPSAPAEAPVESQPQTAEQLEARREAGKLAAEAQQAEEAVASFIERKQALEDQIAIEQDLLQTAREARDNLDLALTWTRDEIERVETEGGTAAEMRDAQRALETVQELQRENRQEIDQRREYLDSLNDRLRNLQEEQLLVQQAAQERKLEAEEARKKSIWLESPLHPKNLWRWISTRGPRMLLVVVVAWALLALVRWSASRIARTVVGTQDNKRSRGANRADTLALSFRSALSLFIVVAAVLLVFQEAGVDIKTVLGGAAILGVALAFGAQNLMRDYFTGFMILLEDQYELGDLITIGAITGTVEKVNMRTTVLRDLEGRVHFVPNGEIKAVTNRTYVWGRAVLEIPIGFHEDVDRVMDVILEVAQEFREDPEVGDWVTDEPVMLGVDKFSESGVIIKFMVQTRPDKIFPTRRQLLRRIKKRFDEEGIDISVPHRVLMRESSQEAEF